MINNYKIKIYIKYNGDIDNWVRSGSNTEKSALKDGDWYLIGKFIEEIYLVNNKLASKEFENKLNEQLIEFCENSQVIDYLKTVHLR